MTKNLLFLGSLYFASLSILIAQEPIGYTEEFRKIPFTVTSNEEKIPYSMFSEDETKRTIYSRTYTTSKGDVKSEFSLTPVCYELNGKLEPIVSIPTEEKDGSWSANQQPIQTKLLTNGSLQLLFPESNRVIISTEKINDHQPEKTKLVSISEEKKTIQLSNGIKKSISFIDGGFKVNYIIENLSSLSSGDLVIREKIELPYGWKLQKVGDEVMIHNGFQEVGIFGQILCFDQNFDAFKGNYKILHDGDFYFLELVIDSVWLHGGRSFPIIIDPTIAGALSQWTGGNIPSCFMPTFNKDSLLVNIPAGVTLTGLYVWGSFYADPFTPATMGIGSMYFSTSCASSQYFTITGAIAASPGTAYLDSFNLLNPLSCCFLKSCEDTSIYVRFHLGRNSLGAGCNSTYIRYDQFTQYKFKVIIYGKTPETYGNEWYVPQAAICSNTCEFTATGYARYGVPPYTFTHPWSSDTVVAGVNQGCSMGNKSNIFTLTNPNCPIYCDPAYTQLQVPTPVIFDACGAQITNIPIATKPILPTPRPIANYDSTLCEGQELNMVLTSCLPGGVINYFGNGINGQGNISQFLPALNDSITIYNYYSYATLNNCTSDTLQHNVYIIPNPLADISILPNPCVVETPFTLLSNSTAVLGPIASQEWSLESNFISSDTSYSSSLDIPGNYTVCINVVDLFGCTDTLCEELNIIPAEIENLNAITPNGDNINDVLYFEYLDLYDGTELSVYNRWGNLVYSASPYLNNWSGDDLKDGIYFYVLTVKDTNRTYSSFFHLLKEP
ncbi:MAG: gliding motility-associated C-terminal domain-containing protein [Bacteroidetes bacterium]|nr:gliding motility-associated C-terminal domain-containing protein [Bacteroidota bacterium]